MESLSSLSRERLVALAEAKRRGLPIDSLLAELGSGQSESSIFSEKYFLHPRQFVSDCFIWKEGEQPTSYQNESLDELPKRKRICGRGPHGLGKTTLNAWIILWFAITRDISGVDWKVVTTAGAWRQLTKFLWPEVHKWARRLNWKSIGREPFTQHELLTLSLKLMHGEAFPVASDNPDLIEGAHATQILYIFDESKAIADKTFDAAEGAFSNTGAQEGVEAYAVAMSTPGQPLGRFYDIQSRKAGFEDWWVRAVSFDEVVEAKRATWTWANQRRAQWGEDSALYQNKVLGKFASQDEQGVIPLSWVEAANERWLELKESGRLNQLPLQAMGVDVGETGDETVIALRSGQVVKEILHQPKQDTMVTTGKVFSIAASAGKQQPTLSPKVIVDVIGIGSGVVNRLKELKSEQLQLGKPDEVHYDVVPFHAAEGTDQKDEAGLMGFINKRAAAWWQMRERLNPYSSPEGSDVALPPDDKLLGDLTSPHYKVTSGGKYQIEAKADIKKRLGGRSTDTGDAVIMSFYESPEQNILDYYKSKFDALNAAKTKASLVK